MNTASPMFRLLAAGATAATLAACMGPPMEKLSEETRSYQLLGHTVPKHFYVDLKDTRSGDVLNRVYVSKHCNQYRSLQIGGVYDLKLATYKRGEETFTRFEGLYDTFCANQQKPRPASP